jgi:hypothetical protein
MAASSLPPRLTDILEAIEHIRGEMAGVTIDAFEADWRKRWLVERRRNHLRGEPPFDGRAQGPASANTVGEDRGHRQRTAPRLREHFGPGHVEACPG